MSVQSLVFCVEGFSQVPSCYIEKESQGTILNYLNFPDECTT